MPAYDFRCGECREVFEVIRSVSDEAEVRCPSCGAAAKRVFTPVGVVLKGSGFHNTDYRRRDAGSDEKPAPCGADKPAGSACSSCPAAD